MEQTAWAWCNKCQGLFYNGNSDGTACPAGGAHDPAGSGLYAVDMSAGAHPHGQPDWAWCHKCQALAYGPGFGSSACPSGGQHENAGSGNYTVDFVGEDTPASQQQGWSWCHKCQSMYYSLNPAGPCAAGDTHDNTGSGAYAISMQPVGQVSVHAAPVIFNETMVLRSTLINAPEFRPDQESVITADATAVVTDSNGGRWCTLNTWVGFPASVDKASWQCRRTQLTVTLPSVVPGTQVLPFSDGSPVATLDLGNGASLPLTVVVDSGAVRLVAGFGDDAAGAAAYDAAIGALSTPPGATVALSCSHDLTVHVPGNTGIVFNPGQIDPGPVIRGPVIRGPIIRGGPFRGGGLGHPVLQPFVARTSSLAAQDAIRVDLDVADNPTVTQLSRRLSAERPDWRRVFIPSVLDNTHTATVVQQGSGGLTFKPQSDASAYPDIPRQQTGGWLQVSPQGSTRSLHCMPGERPELFYYLPTEYRLGFHATDDTSAPATPFRVTMARDAEDRTTITVTMTAMPYLSDDDRRELTTFLLQHELQGSEPYVELRAASGLKAGFQADFLADGQPVAMSSITYALAGVPTSDLLQIRFTMDQLDYGLLAAMLAKGITGAVALSDEHITVSVPVRMQLDKVITNAVTVTLPATPDPPPDPFTASVVLTNTLTYPVSIGAMQLSLVAAGHESGIVFDAEQFDLLSAPLTMDAGAASAPLSYTPSTPSWTSVVTVPGVVTVNGPAPSAWIDAVNRDPSLQPSKVSITLSPSVPAAHLDDIRSVTVGVYAAGDTTPRQPPLDVVPGHDAPLELQLTLSQLAAGLDLRTGFFVEFTSRFADDTRSLPQRVALDLTRKVLDLVVLWEPAGASYYIDADTSIGPVTREVASQLIDTLRPVGKTWAVRAVAPAPPAPAPDPAPPTPSTDPVPPAPPPDPAPPAPPTDPAPPAPTDPAPPAPPADPAPPTPT